jgi:formate/nitrite transporter FocA (FNT family)
MWHPMCTASTMSNEKGKTDSERPTAHEIFDSAVQSARDELGRSGTALLFSGLAGGLTMGLTGLSAGLIYALLGQSNVTSLIAAAVYPVGFLAVIIGRAQLFTENTLYPVVLVLTEKRYVLKTLKLWALVFGGNWIGSVLFAALTVKTDALQSAARDSLIELGVRAVEHPFLTVFWSGVVGGWLLALVAWLVTASHWTTGQAVVTWAMTFILGLGKFAHCIANGGEILSALFAGQIIAGAYFTWLVAATLGNVCGGVVMVSLLNYGQVKLGGEQKGTVARFPKAG